MSNIEPWEAEQRERNARALDAELHQAERRDYIAQAARREERIGRLEAQIAGAVAENGRLRRALTDLLNEKPTSAPEGISIAVPWRKRLAAILGGQ